MLSSGTLNLKFMQRNNNNNTNTKNQNVKPKVESSKVKINETLTTSNTQDELVVNNKGKQKLSAHPINQKTHPTPTPTSTPTWRIVYEESLIHFPFLYSTSSSSRNTILPVHLGRKSFGHSTKSSQKPDPPQSPNKRSNPDSGRTTEKNNKPSKKLKTNSKSPPVDEILQESLQPERQTKVPSISSLFKGIRRTSSQVELEPTAHLEDRSSNGNSSGAQTGFKKPFTSTTIKSKRTHPSKNPSQSSKTSTSSSKPKNHMSAMGSDAESDDTELVKHQIDIMFKEARKSQIASTG